MCGVYDIHKERKREILEIGEGVLGGCAYKERRVNKYYICIIFIMILFHVLSILFLNFPIILPHVSPPLFHVKKIDLISVFVRSYSLSLLVCPSPCCHSPLKLISISNEISDNCTERRQLCMIMQICASIISFNSRIARRQQRRLAYKSC